MWRPVGGEQVFLSAMTAYSSVQPAQSKDSSVAASIGPSCQITPSLPSTRKQLVPSMMRLKSTISRMRLSEMSTRR